MKHATNSFTRAIRAIPFGVVIVACLLAISARAQQANAQTGTLPVPAVAAPAAAPAAQANAAIPPAATPPGANVSAANPAAPGSIPVVPGAPAPSVAGMASSPPGAPTPQSAAAAASNGLAIAKTVTTAPDDTNPFSNVKPVDNQALKQELPAIEQKLQQMQNQMSAIQQVQVALPADALNAPGHRAAAGAAGAGGLMDEQSMELQASTFVACVNGQAMFRDTDQKPFFVDAKEANQNEAVRRIGGCKH